MPRKPEKMPLPDSGFKKTIDGLNVQSGFAASLDSAIEHQNKSIEGATLEHPSVPAREMIELQKLYVYRQRMIDETPVDKTANSERMKRNTEDAVKKIMAYLDTLPVWRAKFSTEWSDSDSAQSMQFSPNDSIYYISPSGASIRFKMANLEKGLEKVFQPIFEKCYFVDNQDNYLEVPILGSNVEELCSQRFVKALQSGDGNVFDSSIDQYRKGYKLIKIGLRHEDRAYEIHDGHRVNKIFD